MKIRYIITLIILASFITTPVCAKKDKSKQLPPGLQKKAAQGEPLPPGWQKKLVKGEILDREIYEHRQVVVPVDSQGLVTIRLEGKLVRLFEATREIVEILE